MDIQLVDYLVPWRAEMTVLLTAVLSVDQKVVMMELLTA